MCERRRLLQTHILAVGRSCFKTTWCVIFSQVKEAFNKYYDMLCDINFWKMTPDEWTKEVITIWMVTLKTSLRSHLYSNRHAARHNDWSRCNRDPIDTDSSHYSAFRCAFNKNDLISIFPSWILLHLSLYESCFQINEILTSLNGDEIKKLVELNRSVKASWVHGIFFDFRAEHLIL